MTRLIDADKLEKVLEEKRKNLTMWEQQEGFDDALRAVDDAPTIERPRGEWIIYHISMLDGEDCKCSVCGKTECVPYWNFCPNCGADMRKEGEAE